LEKLVLSQTEKQLIEMLREIAKQGGDVELRSQKDGTFKVLEIKRKLIMNAG